MTEITTRLSTALADRYTIERELGAGGMATVYLARDLKHERKVAVKVLRPELAAVLGAERFLNEIRVTANLQHSHILPLFDSGEADGFLFYVMPYVAGESLREKLQREKQLPIDEALKITQEVSSALDYAHRHEVIHRDIKPGNILLHDGQALVADFGIALAVTAAGGHRLTETGLSLGTPEYMSPEQATGDRELDARSDIYSLGAVLYEMLAGEPPHTGPTAQAVLAKILTQTAEKLTTRRDTVPLNVEAATLKALEHLPADRFTSADAFSRALTDPGFRHREPGTPGAPTRESGLAAVLRQHWSTGWSLAGLVAIVAGAALWKAWQTPEPTEQALSRFAISLPDGMTMVRVGSYGPALALSRSGTRLAYVAHEGGDTKLYVRRIDEFEAHEVAGTERAWSPFFSPDERWIGFFADHKLKKVPLEGGAPQTLADVSLGGPSLGGATWGLDDTIIFADLFRPGLWQVSAGGGTPERIMGGSDSQTEHPGMLPIWPDMLPHGKTVLYTVGTGSGINAGLAVMSLETGEHRLVTEGGGNGRYVPSGHLVYALGGDLLAQPFDLDELVVTGTPVPVLKGVMTGGEGTGHFAVAWNGSLAYVPGRLAGPARELEWVYMGGDRERLPLPPGNYTNVRISPDGRHLSYLSEGPPAGVWVYDLARGASQRLTDEQADASFPIWTPDGRRLVFQSNRDGGPFMDLAWMPADGSGPEERLLDRPNSQYPHSWADNGRMLIFTETGDPVSQGDVWMLEPGGDRLPRPLLNTASNESLPAVSPDGRWIAFVSDDSGRPEVLVQPFPGPGAKTPISTSGGTGPLWAPNGRELYYRDASGDTVRAVAFEGHPTVRVGNPRILFTGNYVPDYPFGRQYDISAGGDRFLMTMGTPPIQGWTEINVVLGWAESLQEAVPSEAANR